MGEKGKNRHVTIGLFLRGRGGGADQGMVLKQGIFLGRRRIEQVIIFCGVRSADVALLSTFYFISSSKQTLWCLLIILVTACKVVVNQSSGDMNVTHSDYTSLYCFWSIGNTGIPQAIGLVLIREIHFGYCRYSLLLLLNKI